MHSAIKIAKHFVDRANENGVGEMSPLKLMKITFIAHGWMLGIHGKPLVSEDVEAWQYGPVIPELYKDTRQFGRDHIDTLPDYHSIVLEQDEKSIFDQVYAGYSKYTAGQLVGITHKEGTPWDITTKGGKFYGVGVIIPNEIIEAYYHDLSKG